MPITPVEIRHLQLKRSVLGGYRRGIVDRLLEQIATDYEQVWRERADFSDRIEELQAEVDRHVELETLLRNTLVSAEKSARDMKDAARRESDTIVTEAHAEARSILREAMSEKEHLSRDIRQIRALLRSALDAVDAAPESPVETTDEATIVAEPVAVAQDAEPEIDATPAGWHAVVPGEESDALRRLAG